MAKRVGRFRIWIFHNDEIRVLSVVDPQRRCIHKHEIDARNKYGDRFIKIREF